MPIELTPIPPSVASALAEGLPKFAVAATSSDEGESTLRSMRPAIARGSRTISRSIAAALASDGLAGIGAPVTVLGLTDLAGDVALRRTKPKLWVQLLPAAERGKRAMAEVDQTSNRLAAVLEGPEVQSLARRIEGLAVSGGQPSARQELALISVPALHLTAVWLKGASGDADDVVIPNDGPIAPLVPGQRYPLAEFQRIAKAMASDRLAKTGDAMGG